MDLLALPFLSTLAPFVIGGGLSVVALVVWYVVSPRTAAPFIAARVDFVCRFWRFAGPRLTDRGFVTMVLANAGVLFGVGPEKLGAYGTVLWVAANLLFPLWDNHPAGEKLAPSKTKLALEDTDRETLQKMLAEFRGYEAAAGNH